MHHLRRLDFFLRRAALLFSTPLGFLTAGSASLPSLPSGLPSWWFTALAPPAAVRGIGLQGAQFYLHAMHSQAHCCAGTVLPLCHALPSGLPSWWFTALAPPAAVRGIDLQGAQFYHYAMHSQARCCAGCLPSGLPSWWFTALAPPAAVRGIDLQGAQFYHYAMHSQARCCAGCLPSWLPSWWFTALAPPAAVRGIDLQGAQFYHYAMHSQARCCAGCLPSGLPPWWFTALAPPAAVRGIDLLRAGSCQFLVPAALLLLL